MARWRRCPVLRLGIGGPVAGGRQYVPWIHQEDVVRALIKCIEDDKAEGAVNGTAPNPVTNAELSRAFCRTLRRPAFLPVPGFAIGLLYDWMAQVVTTFNALPRAGWRGWDSSFSTATSSPRCAMS